MSFQPKPCRFYNNGHCRYGDGCKFLHICEDYIDGDCGECCNLNHNLYHPQVEDVFIAAGIRHNQTEDKLLNEIAGNPQYNSDCKSDSSESDSDDDYEASGLCEYYLRGKCKFGFRCFRSHELPDNWDEVVYDNSGYECIRLSKRSHEYSDVKQEFLQSMGGKWATVRCIKRVQNPELWLTVDRKRKSMENDYELRLFHGTRPENVLSICQNGFDPNRAGENSEFLHHGHGVYFTSSAKYASKGDFQGSGSKLVILATVLIGNYTKGNPNYYEAPDGFDTCVDKIRKPTKYLKFDGESSYPQYVIYFDD